MLDALHRAGAWIGYRLTKAYWWVRRPIVLGVRVLITDGTRVLLVRHTYREGWFLPGGCPIRHEPLAATAHREAREETGVDVEPAGILGVYSTLSQAASDHVVVFVGRVDPSVSSDARGSGCHASEIDSVRWALPHHLPEKVPDQTRQIVKDWQHGKTGAYRIIGQ